MATYAIHSTVRSRHNRTQRAGQPVHHRFKQHIGSGQRRLIRGRPLHLTEEEFTKHLDEIKAKAAAGILEVRTMDGRKLDLSTMRPVGPAAAPPLPKPPLDSAADDRPWGQEVPPLPGDEPLHEMTGEPSLLSDLDKSAEDEEPGGGASSSEPPDPISPEPDEGAEPQDEDPFDAPAESAVESVPSLLEDVAQEEDAPTEPSTPSRPPKARKGKR